MNDCVVCQMLYQFDVEKMFVENIAKTVWVRSIACLFVVIRFKYITRMLHVKLLCIVSHS